jgi:uncharacterized membrane protein
MILPVTTTNITASFTSGTVSNVTSFTNTSVNATSYEWEFGDGFTSTLQNPTHSYSLSGTYNVKLRAFGNGITTCVDSVTVPVNVIITGIEEHSAVLPVSIRQNPVCNELVIFSMMNTDISITDAAGSVVHASTLHKEETFTMDVRHLNNGVYFIHIPGYKSLSFIKVL